MSPETPYTEEEVAEFEKTRVADPEKAIQMATAHVEGGSSAQEWMDSALNKQRQAMMLRELGLEEQAFNLENSSKRGYQDAEEAMDRAGIQYDASIITNPEQLASMVKSFDKRIKELQGDVKILEGCRSQLKGEQLLKVESKILELNTKVHTLTRHIEIVGSRIEELK